jgi:hypothetical protein
MHSPFTATTIYDGCLCIKTGGESQKSNNVDGALFFKLGCSRHNRMDRQADRKTVSYHPLGRGNKGELNGSRGWGGLRVMSQLPAKIPRGHVTSDVLLSQINSGVNKSVI